MESRILAALLLKVGAARLQVSDLLQHKHACSFEDGIFTPRQSGCTGYAVFPKMLSYVSDTDGWELPVYQAGEPYIGLLLTTV